MIPGRAPTEAELAELRAYLADTAEFTENAGIAVIDNYITDGPGYAGKVILVVWPADPEAITSFIWDKEGRLQQCQ